MMRAPIALLLLAAIAGPVAAQTTAGSPVTSSPPMTTPAPATPPPVKSALKPVSTDTTLPRQKLVTVFGTDPCPRSTDPDEIIVCTRRSDQERDRIPRDLRTDVKPDGPFEGSNRKALLGDASGGAGGGIGSCSAVGPGGGTGCNQALANQYRAARAAGDVPQSILPQITKP